LYRLSLNYTDRRYKNNIFLATHYQEINQHDVINYDSVEMMPKDCEDRKDTYHEVEEMF
jgi:hypothetical protein